MSSYTGKTQQGLPPEARAVIIEASADWARKSIYNKHLDFDSESDFVDFREKAALLVKPFVASTVDNLLKQPVGKSDLEDALREPTIQYENQVKDPAVERYSKDIIESVRMAASKAQEWIAAARKASKDKQGFELG